MHGSFSLIDYSQIFIHMWRSRITFKLFYIPYDDIANKILRILER